MRRPTAVLALLLLPLGLANAAPLESSDLGKGAIELNPSLAFAHNSYTYGGDSFDITTLDVSGLIGYFVSDMVELGGGLLVSHQTVDFGGPAESATAAGLIGGVALNFVLSGNVVPFVRGSVGFLSNSGDFSEGTMTTVIAPLLEGGVRLMVGRSASVNFVVGYQHQSNVNGLQDLSRNSVTLGVGVSVFPVLGK